MAHKARMSRARLYLLLEAFETDIRILIESHLLDHKDESEIFVPTETASAEDRQSKDDNGRDVSIVHYMDLKPAFDALTRSKRSLPAALEEVISKKSADVAALVPIRNRVMHFRPLNMDDPDVATTLVLGFPSNYWAKTAEILQKLNSDPTWEPFVERQDAPYEKTLHNLPAVDYDDTSFIGRKNEANKLLKSLQERRNPVLTLTGEGGIGKTALALDVAYRLLEDPENNPYELMLWVSLKTEQLTAYGVEDLKDAVRSIDGTTVALGRGIEKSFSGSLDDLAQALDGLETLVIIDNLESVQGSEVIEMVDTLPMHVRYLFTSRVGLGELERRIPLPPLSDDEAKLLFRKFASARNQKNLRSLTDSALTEVVKRLRWSPLAIRWYILSSEAGSLPTDLIHNQDELLKFCVENVYTGLTPESQAILSVLRVFDKSISFDEFAILTEFSVDELRASTQELTRGALVVVESESAGGLGSMLALTPTAREFLAKPDHSGVFISEVLKRERTYRASLEKAIPEPRGIDQRIVYPRTESDNPTVFVLNKALKLMSARQFAKATTEVERAGSVNAEFSEVYRVSGLIAQAQSHFESAVSNYKTALRYVEDDHTAAITNYAIADVLATKIHDAPLAVDFAREAYNLKPCGDTAFLLGKILIWTSDFSEGQQLLELAEDKLTGRNLLMAKTLLADSWRRWAEHHQVKRDFGSAFSSASAGLHNALGLYASHPDDWRIIVVLADSSTACLKSWRRMGTENSTSGIRVLERIAKGVQQWGSKVQSKKAFYLNDAIEGCLPSLTDEVGLTIELRRAQKNLNLSARQPHPSRSYTS
ncbi:NB-ARC domain-containing protein [Glutamicibacter sp. AOP12-B1-11]